MRIFLPGVAQPNCCNLNKVNNGDDLRIVFKFFSWIKQIHDSNNATLGVKTQILVLLSKLDFKNLKKIQHKRGLMQNMWENIFHNCFLF